MQVPPNGPQGFLNDYTLSSSGNLESKTSKQNDSDPTCEQCEGNGKVVSYCNTCSNHLCDGCLQAHKTMKALRNHIIVSKADKSGGQLSEQVGPSAPKLKTYYCTVHPEESLKLFCKSCQSLACILCFVASHNGHDIGNIDSNTRKEVEETINHLAEETESKLMEFEANQQYIGAVEKDKVASTTPIKATINGSFDTLITRLESQRAKLLQEVDDSSNNDLKELWAQKEYHETAITSLKGALSFARRSIECEQDTEVLALCSQVKNRLKELNQLNWDSTSTEMAEMTDTQFFQKQVPDLAALSIVRRGIAQPQLDILFYNKDTNPQTGEVRFQVSITIRFDQKDTRKKLHKGAKLTLTCERTTEHRRRTSTVAHETLAVSQSGQSWSASFTPSYAGNYTVHAQAHVTFGQKLLRKKEAYNIYIQ